MTKYMIHGSNVFLGNDLDMKRLDKLPVATYTVMFDPDRGYFLGMSPDFTLPKKLYGNTNDLAGRILNTYQDRSGTTGVLLQGLKGSGKSLAMKKISIDGLALGIPTIIVGSAFCGQSFNKFIQSIEQEAILIFDEFEKVYDKDGQNALLTLFDGIFSTKKLFLLTVNDKYSVNEYMNNRPGRIYYNIQYNGLDAKFIREYCEDKLENKKFIETILLYCGTFTDFNFDMLQALVEELNRYGEGVKEALELLNIKHDGMLPMYTAEYFNADGTKLDAKLVGPGMIRGFYNKEKFTYTVLSKEHPYADASSEWFEEDVAEEGDEPELKRKQYEVATSGAHVTRSEDQTTITLVTPDHKIVLTKYAEKQADLYGVF